MERLTHQQKLIFYYGLLAAVISGIIAATLLVVLTPRGDEAFSEMYFPQPDLLPNKVRTGENYHVEYLVKSHENISTTYALESKLTLYELYDETEGYYNCLAPYRKTIYLDWDNESAPQFITTNKTFDLIPDFTSTPDFHNLITWDEYHAATSFQRERGNGTLIIYFANETNTHYIISISTVTGIVHFNGEYLGTIKLHKDQINTHIHYHDHQLDLLINTINTTIENINASNGQFGFESRDIFAKVGLTTYKDKPIEVPDRGNIWQYNVDLSRYYDFLGNIKQSVQKTLRTTRVYTNYNITENCQNEFACNYLQPKYDEYTLENISGVTELLFTLPSETINNPFWVRTPSENNSRIPFQKVSIQTSHLDSFSDESFSFVFGNEIGILVSEQSLSIIQSNDQGITIKQFGLDSRAENELRKIQINQSDTSLSIQIGNQTFQDTLKESLFNKTFKTFHHNTLRSLANVLIKNVEPACSVTEPSIYCELTLDYPQSRSPEKPSPEQYVTEEESKQQNLLQKLFAQPDKISNNNSEEQANPINESFIPSKTYKYNGPLTTIQNKTNVTFSTQFKSLEGSGAVVLSYLTLHNDPAVTITVYPETNQTIILYDYKGAYYNKTFTKPLEDFTPISLNIAPDTITVRQNRSVLAQFQNNNVRDGYFSLSTIDLHAEFRNNQLRYNNTQTRSLPTTEDPCQLREVYEKTLRTTRFSMNPGINHSFSDNFTITHDFDYGKVSVRLDGSSNTEEPLQIHAWLVRE